MISFMDYIESSSFGKEALPNISIKLDIKVLSFFDIIYLEMIILDEHYKNLDSLIKFDNINNILDAGSGKTSLSYLFKKFPKANIDAVVYPGDNRKINSIKENVIVKYNLKELDLCKSNITETYDLVLAHLLLGEATKFNNKFDDLLNKLLDIDTNYLVIYDFKEDNTMDYNLIEQLLKEKQFKIIEYKTFKKIEEQKFTNFIGKNYVAYVIKEK